MPIIVGILTFMSRLNIMLSLVEHEKIYNFGAWNDQSNKQIFPNQTAPVICQPGTNRICNLLASAFPVSIINELNTCVS